MQIAVVRISAGTFAMGDEPAARRNSDTEDHSSRSIGFRTGAVPRK